MTINFKYKKVDRPHPHGASYEPALPITLIGPKDSIEVIGMLDSGADYSLVPYDMAKILGIDIDKKPEVIGGISGDCKAIKTRVQIRVRKHHESYTFYVKVYVIDDLKDDFPVLIGRSGFFDKFKITFDERRQNISLKRVYDEKPK